MKGVNWTVTGALVGYVDRQGFRFASVIQPIGERFMVLGIVTPLRPDGTTAVDRVLATHAHENLGSYGQLERARRAATSFMRNTAVPAQYCDCEGVS